MEKMSSVVKKKELKATFDVPNSSKAIARQSGIRLKNILKLQQVSISSFVSRVGGASAALLWRFWPTGAH